MSVLRRFSFVLPTTIEFGPGAVRALPEILARLECRRVLVVTDQGVFGAGLLDNVVPAIAGAGISYETYAAVEPNPKEHHVTAGVARAAALGADGIVAVGGGSPIDCAKAIAVLTALGGDVHDYAGPWNVPSPVLPIVAIPTTAGSASEVTFSAVLSDSKEKVKFSYRDTKIAPAFALADPEMTASMPPELTAATGMDALTHAVEAYTATVSEPIADAVALHAIELINTNLQTAIADGGNLEARAGMLMGSILGGIAFSHADVGAVHCIAETLGGRYDLPHGGCNAVVLPVVMEYNLDFCMDKYARVARAMGMHCGDAAADAHKAIARVRELSRQIDLPVLASLDVREGDLAELAELSVRNSSSRSNPRPMARADYMALLRTLMMA
jgi:alcohol dehydrogenase